VKILEITTRLPYPPTDGGKLVTFSIVKYLALRGHDITLICFGDKVKKVPELEKYCKLITIRKNIKTNVMSLLFNLFLDIPYGPSKYHSRIIGEKINNEIKRNIYDIIQLDHLHTAYYGPFIKKKYNLPVILQEHNIENMIMKRYYENQKNIFVKSYAYLQYKKLYKYESKICEIFNRCFMITKIDEKIIKDMNSNIKTSVVPAGVDTSYFYPIKLRKEEFSLVSVASMNWLPNIEAINWFCKEVLPLVKKKIPKIKLYIVGKEPPNSIRNLANHNVFITGFVKDVREYIAKGQIFIVPLKTGSGMRIKILNSLAMGKAIVSTSVGCEGIEVTDGENIFIADSKEEFTEKILCLLNNESKRKRLGENGLKLVKKKYRWEKIVENIENEYKEIIKDNKNKYKH